MQSGHSHGMIVAITSLAIGAFGAVFAHLVSMPAPLLTGPALLVSIASVMGVKTAIPVILRNGCFLVVGTGLGSSVSPEVLANAAKWPVSILAMMISVVTIMMLGSRALHLVLRTDWRTSLLGSVPGHLSFVMGLSLETSANSSLIAVVQSIRLLLLTLLVPTVVAVGTGADTSDLSRIGPTLTPAHLAMVLLAAAAVGFLLSYWKIPAAFLLSGMLVSTVTHGTGLTPGFVPNPLNVVAFVIMGTLIGTRFSGITLHQVLAASLSSLILTVGGLLIVLVASIITVQIVDLPLLDVVIALAPGALETMIAMAVVVGADPTFVGFHHLTRMFFLSLIIPLALARAQRKDQAEVRL